MFEAVGIVLQLTALSCCTVAQELKNDMEVVFPGSKKQKVRKIKANIDVTAVDALPSNEMAAVSATDTSDGRSWRSLTQDKYNQ